MMIAHNGTNDSCTTYLSNFPSATLSFSFGLLNAANSVTATVENSIALFIMLWYRELHSISDRIFISLIITDLFAGLTAAPLHAAQLLSKEISYNCRVEEVRRSLAALLIGVSALTVATISYDRYLHLTKLNNYYKYMTKRKAAVLIIFAWIVPALLPTLRISAETELPYNIAFPALMIIIFITLIVFYALILCSLKRRSAWRESSPRLEKRQLQTMKTVITIITCFVVMGLPVILPVILMPLNIDKETMSAIYVPALTLNMLNSSANPVIYYYRSPNIRRCAKKLFRLDTRRNHSPQPLRQARQSVTSSSTTYQV